MSGLQFGLQSAHQGRAVFDQPSDPVECGKSNKGIEPVNGVSVRGFQYLLVYSVKLRDGPDRLLKSLPVNGEQLAGFYRSYVFRGSLSAGKTDQFAAPVVFNDDVLGRFVHLLVIHIHLQASFGNKINVVTAIALGKQLCVSLGLNGSELGQASNSPSCRTVGSRKNKGPLACRLWRRGKTIRIFRHWH